jgi:hypothetical protein
MKSVLDHITVIAPSLESGAAFVHQSLGVMPQTGGKHVRMGTHNLLLRLGDALFLEVIAPDPQAPAPGRPRWFGLDQLSADARPALGTWVARTADIRAVASASSEPLGNIEPMSRGALDWLITIPADGAIPVDGVGPALIEWHTGAHPATGLADHGLSLLRLELFHPDPDRVLRLLRSIDIDGPLFVSPPATGAGPHLLAHIATPDGARTLSIA